MTVSGFPEPPGPRDPRRLSSREEAILARIESDLVDDDPDLSRLASASPSMLPVALPVAAREIGLLVVVLLILVGAAVLVPPALHLSVLPALTVLLVVPWTVLCARRSTDG